MIAARSETAGGALASLFRERLPGPADPLPVARWLRGEPRGVALSGAWAGGSLLLTSHPLLVADAGDDPFEALDRAPLELSSCTDSSAVGGGWFGWLGFGLARSLEAIGAPPPRAQPLPALDLAFHDHVVRRDAQGDWWFEALWTARRAPVLRERLAIWRARLASPAPPALPFSAEGLRPAAPGLAGHRAAVAEAVERIREGELSQVNLCLVLESRLSGDPLDLWVHAAGASGARYAAYVAGAGHVVASLSPELFLRRRGRDVRTRPIKGTAPRSSDPARLATRVKDRAENVMIVDLMRNDLGRVCEYGTVAAQEICAVEPAAGVWHLVSTVTGALRSDVTDGRLLRATFPPGSVTGAPKVQALKTINLLEASAREVYCGAIGFSSPAAGLELNVAIRTFEVVGQRIRLGAGGGIVSDSLPDAELQEALDKAAGVAAAAGLAVEPEPVRRAALPTAINRLPRPDPQRGLIETIRVRAGEPLRANEHLRRLRHSCETVGLAVPPGVDRAVRRAAASLGDGALRVTVAEARATIDARPLPASSAVRLTAVTLPGGLGAHKWADRTLIDSHTSSGAAPLFCDIDGTVLEAGHAAVILVTGSELRAVPLDGRVLPSISREHFLAAARRAGLRTTVAPFTLTEVSRAEGLILTSSLRGPHPGLLAGAPSPRLLALCEELSGDGGERRDPTPRPARAP